MLVEVSNGGIFPTPTNQIIVIMKVDDAAILRYKIARWLTKYGGTVWGIDVIIDGKSYHVKDDRKLYFDTKSEAIKYVRNLNKELRTQKSNNTTL